MPLTTRCARCGRLFPIYAQQLRPFGSRVSCPQCGHRFNGRSALTDEPMLDPGILQGRARLGLGGQRPPRNGSGTRVPPGRGQARRPAQPADPMPMMLPPAEPTRRRGPLARLLGALVFLVLALGLAAQLLWWNRVRLLQDPGLRRIAADLCGQLHCTLPVIRIDGALEVLGPSLTEAPAADGMTLSLRIRNTAEVPQPAPLLDLELLDNQGERVAARRFTPAEYGIGEGARLLAPDETIPVAITIAAIRTPTSGFKVRLP